MARLYGLITLLPLFYQELLGYTALAAGWAVSAARHWRHLAMPIIGILTSKIDNRWLDRHRLRSCSASAGLWFGEVNLAISQWSFLWAIVLSGFGSGAVFVPLSTTAVARLPNEEIGNASGLYNLFRNVGGSIGISIVNTIVARHEQLHQNELVHSLTSSSPIFQNQLHALTAVSVHAGLSTGGRYAKGLWADRWRTDGAGLALVLRRRLPLHGAGVLRLHPDCVHAEEDGQATRRAARGTLKSSN